MPVGELAELILGESLAGAHVDELQRRHQEDEADPHREPAVVRELADAINVGSWRGTW
jgi:hypothetical protein